MYYDLTRGKISRSLILFALPMIAGNLLQQFYNIADTLIVGRVLGSNALAAVGSSYTLMTFLTSIFLGLSMGAGALFSIYQGRKDLSSLKLSILHAFLLILAVTLVLNLAVYAGIEPILTFLRVPDEVRPGMRTYLLIIFAGLIATSVYNFFSCMLRALGNSSVPLIFLAVSAVLNIALDLLFVAVLPFGIAGAALATVLAQYVSAVGILLYVLLRCRMWLPSKKEWRFSHSILKEILNLSSMTCIQQSVMNFGILMVQGLVNSFGTVIMAAFAAAVKIDSFAYMPVQDFGNAFSTYVAQNYGAGQTDRIRKGILQGLVMAAIIGVCSVGLGLLLTIDGAYLHIFLSADKVTADTIRFGNHFLYVDFSMYLLLCFLFVIRNCVQGIQRAPFVLWAGASELIARVAICLTLPALLSGGVVSAQSPELAFYALCAADPLAWLAADLALLLPFFKNMMHMNYQYLYGGVEQHLLGK